MLIFSNKRIFSLSINAKGCLRRLLIKQKYKLNKAKKEAFKWQKLNQNKKFKVFQVTMSKLENYQSFKNRSKTSMKLRE